MRYIKYIMSIILLLILCTVSYLWGVLSMLSSIVTNGNRWEFVAISFDRMFNTAIGGNPLETLSSRCWSRKDEFKYLLSMKMIDWVFSSLLNEENHCENSYKSYMKSLKDSLK